MEQDYRIWVFMPAGAQDGKSGRSQCRERFDLLDDERAQIGLDAGIGFGIELKGPAKAKGLGWTPDQLDGVPYTVHMGNEDLSVLFAAEQERDSAKIDAFWTVIEWLSWLNPKPLSVGMHGARLNTPIVNLDEHRYDWKVPPADFLALQDWHGERIRIIKDKGLIPAIETVSPTQFVGPPLYGKDAVWAPLTYHEARIGAHPTDLCWLRDRYGAEIWVDLEHLFFGLNFLNHGANYAGMTVSRDWTLASEYDEMIQRIGYAADIGQVPSTREPMKMLEAIKQMAASHLHVGGSLAEVVDIQPGESEPPAEYIEKLKAVLDPYPGMFEETVGKRVGSHDSIHRTDQVLRERLKVALAAGAKTMLVETSGYTSADCWYWAREDALEYSYFDLLAILQDLLE